MRYKTLPQSNAGSHKNQKNNNRLKRQICFVLVMLLLLIRWKLISYCLSGTGDGIAMLMLFVLWDFVRGMALFRFTVISIPLLN